MKEIYYEYTDPLNDEFSGIKRDKCVVTKDFKFINKNILWNIVAFILYKFFIYPYAYLYMKIKFHLKVKGRKKLKGYKNPFLYGNHTQAPGDGFLPPLLTRPYKPYFVVNSDNIALKGTKNFILMMGAIPIPTEISGLKNFEEAIHKRNEKKPIVIYPEAHIWPYFTDIRPFKEVSFKYPLKNNRAVFSFTNVYTKRRFSKKANITTYIDGPFFPDLTLNKKEASKKLRDEVYNAMKERAKLSVYEYKYHYKEKC